MKKTVTDDVAFVDSSVSGVIDVSGNGGAKSSRPPKRRPKSAAQAQIDRLCGPSVIDSYKK